VKHTAYSIRWERLDKVRETAGRQTTNSDQRAGGGRQCWRWADAVLAARNGEGSPPGMAPAPGPRA